jgi:hypothetical protein
VRWFLFGAQAAILYGVARLSADVDITVDLGGKSSREVVDALGAAGFELRIADAAGFVDATRVLPFVHRASRIPDDVVLAGPGLEDQFFAGVQDRVIGAARVPVVAAEDLVAMKVLAGRPRDVDDVAAILHAHRDDLDLHRIRTTLALLEAALDRRDLLSEPDRLLIVARRAGNSTARVRMRSGKRRRGVASACSRKHAAQATSRWFGAVRSRDRSANLRTRWFRAAEAEAGRRRGSGAPTARGIAGADTARPGGAVSHVSARSHPRVRR